MLPSVPTLAKPWPEGEEHASLECIMPIRCTKSAWLNLDPSLAAYNNFLSSGYVNNNFFNIGSAASATLYRDASHEVLLNTRTGAIRNAPWISLRTPGDCVYLAKLIDGQVALATFNTALSAVAASVSLGAYVAVVATLAALGTVVATAAIATVVDAAVFAAAFNAVVAAASTAVVTVSNAALTVVIAISVVAATAAAFAAAVAFDAVAKATRSSLNESNGIPRRSLSTSRAPGSLARLVVLASLPAFGDCDLITWPATESGPDATMSQALVVPLFSTAAALAILLAMVVLSCKLWASRYGSYIDLDSPAHVEGAGIEDMDNAFWHITRAVITLLRAGMPGDVPDTSTTSKGGMTRARKHLRDMGIPFDVMTPQQIKCASWLLLYAGTHSPVSGVASRRHAFGLIRHQIDTLRSHNVPYGNAILPLVPGFTNAVMLGRTSYSAAFNGEGNLIRRAYAKLWISCMLLGDNPPPHDVAVWAPRVSRRGILLHLSSTSNTGYLGVVKVERKRCRSVGPGDAIIVQTQ